jgi:hypothetical protein
VALGLPSFKLTPQVTPLRSPLDTSMHACFLLGITLLTLLASPAEAQVSAYGMVALSSYGFSYQGSSFRFNNDTASLGGGAFYNFPIHSRLTAGIDGRVLYGPASNGGTTADVALRIGFVPTHVRLRPYFEIGGGMVSAVSNPGLTPSVLRMERRSFLAASTSASPTLLTFEQSSTARLPDTLTTARRVG